MALIKCPECGKEISDKAISCPNCGYPITESQAMENVSDTSAINAIQEDACETMYEEATSTSNVVEPVIIPLRKGKKKLKSRKIAMIGVASVAVILVIIASMFSNRSNEKLEHQSYTWPSKGLATLLPTPESLIGEIQWDASYGFNIYVAETSNDAFNAYIDKCSNEGFDVDYQRGKDYYYAYNSDGNRLEIQYEDGVMQIQIHESEKESADSNNADSDTTNEETQTTIVTSSQYENSSTYRTDGFEYVILSDGTAQITKYIGNDSSVSISSIDGHDVSSIGKEAFKNCTKLSELWFSSNVISIGESAFEGCTSLVEVDVKAPTIEEAAFKGCTSLVELWFSSDVKSIGRSAFEGCSSLIEVDIKAPTVGEAAFKNCTNLIELWFSTEVMTIGKSAFEGCVSLVQVDLKAPTVSEAAFKGCTSLAEIWFSSDVKSVEKYAFEGCTSLTDISGSTKNIAFNANAFANCPKLRELPDGIVVTNDIEEVKQSEPQTISTSCSHQKGEWKLTKDATLTTVGVEECFCTVCGESIDSRGTERKNAKVVGSSFNFGDIEFLDWLNELSTAEFSYIELEAFNNGNTTYPVTMQDGVSGAMIFQHDDNGNICAVMAWFDDWEDAAALVIWIADKIDSDFSEDDAFVPIANDEVYMDADIAITRLSLSADMEVSLLTPSAYLADMLR